MSQAFLQALTEYPERFLDRLETSRAAKARPIGLPLVAVFHLDEGFLFRTKTNATKKKTTETPCTIRPALNSAEARASSARASNGKRRKECAGTAQSSGRAIESIGKRAMH